MDFTHWRYLNYKDLSWTHHHLTARVVLNNIAMLLRLDSHCNIHEVLCFLIREGTSRVAIQCLDQVIQFCFITVLNESSIEYQVSSLEPIILSMYHFLNVMWLLSRLMLLSHQLIRRDWSKEELLLGSCFSYLIWIWIHYNLILSYLSSIIPIREQLSKAMESSASVILGGANATCLLDDCGKKMKKSRSSTSSLNTVQTTEI